ncbi:MAG: nucleotide exchange factor GrpE [Oscillospiraceae bacterium]|nr:nucleotide exchange factor GrpE [Oscillospiraceae bacterium]
MENNQENIELEGAAEETEAVQEEKPDIEAISPEQLKIEALEKQLNEEKDKYLRVAAEYDNFRRRSVSDRLLAVSDAQSKVITEFLSVIDNFERALAAETTDENYKKGVEMIFNQYKAILEKLGVTEIEALNCQFDPNVHNAVNQVEDENFGENTVCQVFQKGYKLGDKVIRCAMVVVANP